MTHASGDSTNRVVDALRELGAAGTRGADFDGVRRLAQRRRDQRAIAGAMAGVIGLIAAVAVGPRLGALGGSTVAVSTTEPIASAAAPSACPRTYPGLGAAGWTMVGAAPGGAAAVLSVPASPAVAGAQTALVPPATPDAAILCRYAGAAPRTDGPYPPDGSAGAAVLPLAGGVTVTVGLDRLAADLALVGTVDRRRTCYPLDFPAVPYYLLGLDYPAGRVWVAATDNPWACDLTATNGAFSTAVDLGPAMGAMDTAGAWAGFVARPGTTECPPSATGRVGGELSLAPGEPASVDVCYHPAAGSQRHTSLTPRQASGILQALRALPTTPSDGKVCSLIEGADTYAVVLHYASGPDATVRLTPACGQLVLGDALQAVDGAGTVAAAVEAAARW